MVAKVGFDSADKGLFNVWQKLAPSSHRVCGNIGGIDPTTYIVLSQARLLMTAVLMKYSMGKGQTSLQWMDLVNLTFLIIIFQMLPNDFVTSKSKGATVKDNAALGVIMTMAKVVLSVYAGVAQQKAMQGDSPGGRVSFIAQVLLLRYSDIALTSSPRPPEGRRKGELHKANFTRLVLGCIEAEFCK